MFENRLLRDSAGVGVQPTHLPRRLAGPLRHCHEPKAGMATMRASKRVLSVGMMALVPYVYYRIFPILTDGES